MRGESRLIAQWIKRMRRDVYKRQVPGVFERADEVEVGVTAGDDEG